MNTLIFSDKIPNLGSVTVYDHTGHPRPIGRYQVYKLRRLPNGKFRHSYVYRHQRPAAIAHAQKWLASLEGGK